MAEIIERAEQICPACGCRIGKHAYRKGKVLYCCEACATSGQCECGCCKEVMQEE